MDTFSPSHAPSNSSTTQFDARVISNKFGDGYRQTALDGFNAVAATVSLSWAACTISDADYMQNFMLSHVGQPFFYTLPRESTPRKFDCTSWRRGYPSGGYDTFSATIMERFDLG